jgi:hypothetical protein
MLGPKPKQGFPGMDDKTIIDIANRILSFQQRANGSQARQEIQQLLGKITDHHRLEPFGFKIYSQGDEDGIIEEICKRLNIEQGVFCEIGVENGLECNSLYLIHKGWRGGWIEGGQNQAAFIAEKFRSVIPKRLKVVAGFVTAQNINALIGQAIQGFGELDFLSIDIDGNDIYLFEALEAKPKIVCIEYNPKFPAAMSKQQTHDPKKTWRGTDYMGASLKAMAAAATAKGYRLVGTNITGANAFFVRADLAGNKFPADASAENLYNPARYWLIYDHFRNIGHPADFGEYEDLK